ncbi:right-handed parallel beta-helix repeat-containing protein, partial [bacterium]|nr:right-handed parallel beta-helix repeat-containing protein [bacterium]
MLVVVKCLSILSILVFTLSCTDSSKEFVPSLGETITQSVLFQKDTFKLNGTDSLNQPVLTIEGKNIVVDFNDAIIAGSNDKKWPNEFYGLAILIKNSQNITLKNANIRGFKIAVLAENVDSLKIENCNFGYNYRQKLKSIRERENLSDWLSYHQNDQDEWLRYGMGIYLKNCNNALVKNVHITGGQNGLMMTQCNNGLFYNNEINFNSGIGIGLYRSSNNQLLHNKLDWNVRGYSHGFYSRGQDSAGILVYEQSNENTFAFNSATHSGDGFFLWAGQTTMDTGEGGCNRNLIYGNDFSHAPTNGIEVTFSSNKLIKNILTECRYGVWGGYSYQTLIEKNKIEDCEYGMAFEHGNNNLIIDNRFNNSKIGVQLSERDKQPNDWGFSKNRDISSRNYHLLYNRFDNIEKPLNIVNTKKVLIEKNHIWSEVGDFPKSKGNEKIVIYDNKGWNSLKNPRWNINGDLIENEEEWLYVTDEINIEKLKDGLNAFLPENHPRGRQYILINEWGPYDFKYPVIWLREINENKYTFLLLGPQGNWKCIDGKGLKNFGPKTGTFPATIVAEKDSNSDEIALDLVFIGEEVTDQFGKKHRRGTVCPFSFYR